MPDESSIPEYYRHFVKPKPEAAPPPAAQPTHQVPPAWVTPPAQAPPLPAAALPPEAPSYQAHAFALALPPETWADQSAYVFAGPVSDGLQHNITVTLDPDLPDGLTLDAYADLQLDSIRGELRGCHLLLHDALQLDCGIPAHRAVFRWEPSDAVRVYQEQLYVLAGRMGYKLTATYTRKTRKTLGPVIERIMKSFVPKPPAVPPPAAQPPVTHG